MCHCYGSAQKSLHPDLFPKQLESIHGVALSYSHENDSNCLKTGKKRSYEASVNLTYFHTSTQPLSGHV